MIKKPFVLKQLDGSTKDTKTNLIKKKCNELNEISLRFIEGRVEAQRLRLICSIEKEKKS